MERDNTYGTRWVRNAVLLFFLVAFLIPARGQIVINEFSASNSRTIADPDFQEYPDWLELYNTDSTARNLKGFYLTDDLGTPDKWQVLIDAVIEPGGFLLIWTDGRDTLLHSSFKISAGGEELGLYTPALRLMDAVTFTAQMGDVSYGRFPDGNGEWGYFMDPTPGKTNTTESLQGIVFNVPEFSVKGGIFSGPLSVELTSRFGGDIRYTLNGSEPEGASALFTAPINITGTTILRARIFKPGSVPGPVITHSYFINENSVGGKLPVVSIATNPENFWDPETGIYTQNFKPEWEVPVNIELFENNGLDRAAFNQRAGVKINGLYSWQLPQKMLGIYFKKAYGTGNLDYQVTPQRNRTSYKSFALRASGSDWSYTLFRDVLSHHAVLFNTGIDIQGFKPAVVYVNGEYLGIHNIREKVDADYIETSYNLDPGSFDLVENQSFPEAGDLDAYEQLEGLLNKDLSVPANYSAVAELVDIENFTDMVITEMACRNTSIDHNVMSWKPKEGGKWKWVLMDLDRGFFNAGSSYIDFYLNQRQLILSDLFRSSTYKEYFARRLASQLFTTFNAERMKSLIDEHEAAIESEVPRHVECWYGTTSSYGDAIPSESYWRTEVCNLRSFVEERPVYLLADLQNYGFSGISNLALACTPAEAGRIKINGLKTAGPLSYGPFLQNMDISLEARDRPGYEFTGWYELSQDWIIPKGATWKYNDSGTMPDPDWFMPGYNDDSWSSGPAELGYGDNDESTVISYGGNSSYKYITTYFRKSFDISAGKVENGIFFLHLKKDDGAVVYLNGTEIARANLRCGSITYNTTATVSINAESEDVYIVYRIDNNLLNEETNILAVEVHQESRSSSDLSFDLGLSCYMPDTGSLYSSNSKTRLGLSHDRFINAKYTAINICILPAVIAGDTTLSIDCSPYLVQEDLIIPENVTLTIDPGVVILMPDQGNIFVEGVLEAIGTSTERITIKQNPDEPGKRWGGMVFSHTSEPSVLQFVTIEGASGGPDPTLENAAISSFSADLVLDNLVIENVYSNPVVSRYSDIVLTNSVLHSEVTGDLINVKYGNARIEHCRFTGNDRVDSDGIDYDEVNNGIIRGCTISGFYGFNSDAVDIGEEAHHVVIDSLVVFNVTDKGVSLGQHTSATIENSIFMNCDMGVAVKDSSSATIRNCVFYSTGNPVACYEKNIGLAGGNAHVVNSILSNSSDDSYMADDKSMIRIEYSLSDNLPLPGGNSNLFGNPLFVGPTFFDFGLSPSSPGIQAGDDVGEPVDLGTTVQANGLQPVVMISKIFINGSNLDLPQFVSLYNPSGETIDLSGYAIDKGITAVIPDENFIRPGGCIYITSDSNHYLWDTIQHPVIQWSVGSLAVHGESIRLVDPYGIVLDYLEYSGDEWPAAGFESENVFTLTDPALDNHFGENWTVKQLSVALEANHLKETAGCVVYPNPTSGLIFADNVDRDLTEIEVFSISGQLLRIIRLHQPGTVQVDLSGYGAGLYLLKIGSQVVKVAVIE